MHETGGAEPDNVIRFPRDWFGSTDDLVPINAGLDPHEAETAPRGEDADSLSLNASDFWGGASGALHQAVQEPDLSAAQSARPESSNSRVWPLRRPPTVALFVVMLGLALAVFLAGPFGARRSVASAADSRLTLQRAAAGTAASALPGDAAVGASVDFAATASAEVLAAERRLMTQGAKLERIRRQRNAARRAHLKHHRATAPVPSSAPSAVGVPLTNRAPAVVSASPATTYGAPQSASTDSTQPISSQPAPSQPASSTPSSSAAASQAGGSQVSSSSSVPAGPSSPGTAGADCNPQCT